MPRATFRAGPGHGRFPQASPVQLESSCFGFFGRVQGNLRSMLDLRRVTDGLVLGGAPLAWRASAIACLVVCVGLPGSRRSSVAEAQDVLGEGLVRRSPIFGVRCRRSARAPQAAGYLRPARSGTPVRPSPFPGRSVLPPSSLRPGRSGGGPWTDPQTPAVQDTAIAHRICTHTGPAAGCGVVDGCVQFSAARPPATQAACPRRTGRGDIGPAGCRRRVGGRCVPRRRMLSGSRPHTVVIDHRPVAAPIRLGRRRVPAAYARTRCHL